MGLHKHRQLHMGQRMGLHKRRLRMGLHKRRRMRRRKHRLHMGLRLEWWNRCRCYRHKRQS
jgi:hypothetical protein